MRPTQRPRIAPPAAAFIGACLALIVWVAMPLPARAAPLLPAINADGLKPQIIGSLPWFDLVTDDVDESRRFYAALFGWRFRTLGSGPAAYTVITLGTQDIGGMFTPPRARPQAARWLALISVADPAAAAQWATNQGGRVLVPPADAPQRGTHALLADAQGAVFGVLRSASGDPPDAPLAEGDFFWADLFTPDPAGAAEFYRRLAGYEVDAADSGGLRRLLLSSAGFARAGIAQLPRPDMRPGWLPYVLVGSVPATLERARAAGARVLVEPRAELLDGRLAVIADPRGAPLGLVDWRNPPGAGGVRR